MLQRPEWHDKRKSILKRDNWTCQLCGITSEEMHVHHMWYEDDFPAPWQYPDYALITLCYKCHEDEEFHKNFTTHGVKYLLQLGFLHRDLSDMICSISQRIGDEESMEKVRDYVERVKFLIKNG